MKSDGVYIIAFLFRFPNIPYLRAVDMSRFFMTEQAKLDIYGVARTKFFDHDKTY